MTDFAVAKEDALSEAIAKALLKQTGGHTVHTCPRKNGNGYLKRQISAFNRMAQTVMPVLLLTDLDRWTCPLALMTDWLPGGPARPLLFRIAVRTTESWVLSDREAFAGYLGVSVRHMPARPDDLANPKAALLKVVRKSKHRDLKQDILPRPGVSCPVGLGYNDRLVHFVSHHWDSRRAAQVSDSLARALAGVTAFNA